jgi:dienelactone hydrolase
VDDTVLGGDLTEADLSVFQYERAPLEITEIGSEKQGEIEIKDITFVSPVDGEAIEAFLVVPPGEGPFPAVLYIHGLPGNRSRFLDEAVAFAESDGVAGLLVDAVWSNSTWIGSGRSFETDYQDNISVILDLRQALDVLEAQSFVDATRIAYVGHDFGSVFGGTLAGVDHRPIAYVLMAGTSNFLNWIINFDHENFPLKDYVTQMDSIAAIRFIANSAPSAVFFQFSSQDRYTPADDIFAYFKSAPEPKEIELYDTSHNIGCDECVADRYAFLREQFGL